MSIFTQIKDQYTTLPIPKPEKCVGRTYVVTGANTGLGLECAKHLVRLSAKKVVLGVRSLSKGEAAKAKIEEDTGIKGVAEVWPLDLSSADSTKDFARKVLQLDRLDAIIENAGLALPNYTTSDGFETTLTVNVINTFLLATLVFPKLQESAKKSSSPSHLVIVGSDAAWGAKGELEKMNGDMLEGLNEPESMKEGAMKRYPVSKLLQFYAVRQLAQLRPPSETGVIINYLSPGLCRTELSRNAPFGMWMLIEFMRLLMARTAEQGSRTLLHGAVTGQDTHGKYLSECVIREFKVPPWVTDKMQDRVWESLTKRLNTVQPGCI